ncbi:hypothetical protein O9K51_04968 [Purpureocillium lavendulum]|uniref:Uncharacterized protein n=1 Tax=Purpureocillium lavendulum TaxID=1247861 RepID=A0AB34FPI2_9HYPO|nr:hypothetical protein O9K51_04968 [Purpureocillium lavendulum]
MSGGAMILHLGQMAWRARTLSKTAIPMPAGGVPSRLHHSGDVLTGLRMSPKGNVAWLSFARECDWPSAGSLLNVEDAIDGTELKASAPPRELHPALPDRTATIPAAQYYCRGKLGVDTIDRVFS